LFILAGERFNLADEVSKLLVCFSEGHSALVDANISPSIINNRNVRTRQFLSDLS